MAPPPNQRNGRRLQQVVPPPCTTFFPQFFTPELLRFVALAQQLTASSQLPNPDRNPLGVMPLNYLPPAERNTASFSPCKYEFPTLLSPPPSSPREENKDGPNSRKRQLPNLEDGSSCTSDSDQPTRKQLRQAKSQKAEPKRKHEATLDGERRVAIDFENYGTLGTIPQTYGKGVLIVPDGVCGKYTAFGQRWKFSIAHKGEPVVCEDGVLRTCLSWNITNLSSGQTHTVVETCTDALKRDRDGKTLCNRAFREALALRAEGLQAECKQAEINDPHGSLVTDIESQLKTLKTKRFSEGPLFFGLRHASLQKEMQRLYKIYKETRQGE